MAEMLKIKEPTIGSWLAQDVRRAPEAYSRRTDFDLGVEDLPISRYTSREFHDLEIKHMWSKVWQMACHETDIPEVGDYITYEIGLRSFVVVRTAETEIKAYPNACLHRGMQLVDDQGHTGAFRCRFHGWTWNLDGSLRRVTEGWDFPQIEGRKMCLPDVKVGTWGGFVFINPDPNAEPFEDFIGELPDHFRSAPLENRRVAFHVARIMPANWKVAMEAFIESYHVSPTHPQSAPVSEYAETQYDLYGPNLSRLATVSIAPASSVMKAMSPQEFADFGARTTGREPVQLNEGQTYREVLAQERRNMIASVQGEGVEHLSDCEMLDAVEYFLFPNFMPWHGFGLPIVYRFRPNGDDHTTSILEVYVMAPRNLSEPCPKAPAIDWLPEDSRFSDHKGLDRLGPIFDQDHDNIVGVWKGLHSTFNEGAILGRYQEARIRHYHKRIDDFIKADA